MSVADVCSKLRAIEVLGHRVMSSPENKWLVSLDGLLHSHSLSLRLPLLYAVTSELSQRHTAFATANYLL